MRNENYRVLMCGCVEGAYLGAHAVGTPERCERCGRLTQDQWGAIQEQMQESGELVADLAETNPRRLSEPERKFIDRCVDTAENMDDVYATVELLLTTHVKGTIYEFMYLVNNAPRASTTMEGTWILRAYLGEELERMRKEIEDD